MLENLKNKLRQAFGLKARPPEPKVPDEIVNNKYVRKAVNKSQRGRLFKRLALIFGASAAVSTGLQYTPDLVSTPMDTFMAEKASPTITRRISTPRKSASTTVSTPSSPSIRRAAPPR